VNNSYNSVLYYSVISAIKSPSAKSEESREPVRRPNKEVKPATKEPKAKAAPKAEESPEARRQVLAERQEQILEKLGLLERRVSALNVALEEKQNGVAEVSE